MRSLFPTALAWALLAGLAAPAGAASPDFAAAADQIAREQPVEGAEALVEKAFQVLPDPAADRFLQVALGSDAYQRPAALRLLPLFRTARADDPLLRRVLAVALLQRLLPEAEGSFTPEIIQALEADLAQGLRARWLLGRINAPLDDDFRKTVRAFPEFSRRTVLQANSYYFEELDRGLGLLKVEANRELLYGRLKKGFYGDAQVLLYAVTQAASGPLDSARVLDVPDALWEAVFGDFPAARRVESLVEQLPRHELQLRLMAVRLRLQGAVDPALARLRDLARTRGLPPGVKEAILGEPRIADSILTSWPELLQDGRFPAQRAAALLARMRNDPSLANEALFLAALDRDPASLNSEPFLHETLPLLKKRIGGAEHASSPVLPYAVRVAAKLRAIPPDLQLPLARQIGAERAGEWTAISSPEARRALAILMREGRAQRLDPRALEALLDPAHRIMEPVTEANEGRLLDWLAFVRELGDPARFREALLDHLAAAEGEDDAAALLRTLAQWAPIDPELKRQWSGLLAGAEIARGTRSIALSGAQRDKLLAPPCAARVARMLEVAR